MNDKKGKITNSSGNLMFLGIPAVIAICCGLPTLLSAIGFTAIGAFLVGKEIWEFGVILIIIGVFVFIKKIISKENDQADCYSPKNDSETFSTDD